MKNNANVTREDHETIKFIVRLSNSKVNIEKFTNCFNFPKLSEKIKLNYLSAFEQEYSKSKNFAIYKSSIDYFNSSVEPKNIDEFSQKIFFCFFMSVDFDSGFYKDQYDTPVKGAFVDWVENGIYMLRSPNLNSYKKLKSYQYNIKYLLALVRGVETEPKNLSYELDDTQKYVVDVIKKSPYFDTDYYLNNNKDVRDSGIDPCYHYAMQGYKEGRNPSLWFDSAFYLENNKDVESAGVNPLYHYIVSGAKEKRSVKNILDRFIPKLSFSAVSTQPEAYIPDALNVLELESSYQLIVLTHDNVKKRTGGIQKVVNEELSKSKDYLLLSPTSNPQIFHGFDAKKNLFGYVNLSFLRSKIKKVDFFIVHSLINFNQNSVAEFPFFKLAQRIYVWVHDYSLICQNFLLLRNNYENCGAPPLASTSCEVCCYGENRKSTSAFTQKIIDRFNQKLIFVTPSKVSSEIFKRSYPNSKVLIRNHFSIQESPSRTISIKRNDLTKTRIGYLGGVQRHKGFGYFITLTQKYKNAEYFIFSSEELRVKNIRYVECNSTGEIGAPELIESMGIDYLILPSTWEETFCIAVYEGLSAGAKILALRGSGNIEELAKTIPDVLVFNNVDEIANYLNNVESSVLQKNFYNINSQMNLRYLNVKK